MLDDLAKIHQLDKEGALDIAAKEPEQLSYQFNFQADLSGIQNVVYAAMGGSALAALLSQTWPGYCMPFEIVRNYDLPAYVSRQTLCIIASYSGNTEETLSALAQAESKSARIVVIAGGGQLADIAKEKGYPLIILPGAKQPRYGVFYCFRALIEIGIASGIMPADPNWQTALQQASSFLIELIQEIEPVRPVSANLAKQIALDCLGKSVVIYAGPKLAPAAYKWKISFNENAKQVAWFNVYPEFNHNEFVGWSEQPVDKPYCVIDLRSDLELPQIRRRFEFSERLLSGRRPAPLVVNAKGHNILEQMLYCVVLGDFTSLYAAIANGLNPAPVELVEKLKLMMKD